MAFLTLDQWRATGTNCHDLRLHPTIGEHFETYDSPVQGRIYGHNQDRFLHRYDKMGEGLWLCFTPFEIEGSLSEMESALYNIWYLPDNGAPIGDLEEGI